MVEYDTSNNFFLDDWFQVSLLATTQGGISLVWSEIQSIEAVNAEIGTSCFDCNLIRSSFVSRNIACWGWTSHKACLAWWHQFWILCTSHSIHWWNLQLVHSILVRRSVHWHWYLLLGFCGHRLENAVYSHFHACNK